MKKNLSLLKVSLGDIFHSTSQSVKSHVLEVIVLWDPLARWRAAESLPPDSVLRRLIFQKKLQVSVHFLIIEIYLKVNLTFGVVDVAEFLHCGSMKQRLKVYFSGFLNFQENIVIGLWLVSTMKYFQLLHCHHSKWWSTSCKFVLTCSWFDFCGLKHPLAPEFWDIVESQGKIGKLAIMWLNLLDYEIQTLLFALPSKSSFSFLFLILKFGQLKVWQSLLQKEGYDYEFKLRYIKDTRPDWHLSSIGFNM